MPSVLFWMLEGSLLFLLLLLLWLAQALRRWPGPAWLRQEETGTLLRLFCRILLLMSQGTIVALLLLVTGFQGGWVESTSFNAFTPFNLELLGLFVALLLHAGVSRLFPLQRRVPQGGPGQARSAAPPHASTTAPVRKGRPQ